MRIAVPNIKRLANHRVFLIDRPTEHTLHIASTMDHREMAAALEVANVQELEFIATIGRIYNGLFTEITLRPVYDGQVTSVELTTRHFWDEFASMMAIKTLALLSDEEVVIYETPPEGLVNITTDYDGAPVTDCPSPYTVDTYGVIDAAVVRVNARGIRPLVENWLARKPEPTLVPARILELAPAATPERVLETV